jgi:hypothetical protein
MGVLILAKDTKVPFCTLVFLFFKGMRLATSTGIWMMWQYILFVLLKLKLGGVEWNGGTMRIE